jgi:hypothetical protein
MTLVIMWTFRRLKRDRITKNRTGVECRGQEKKRKTREHWMDIVKLFYTYLLPF